MMKSSSPEPLAAGDLSRTGPATEGACPVPRIRSDASGDAGKYYDLLGGFTQLCNRLVDNGLPYVTVLLCHELYRFLYPVEPYADFKHDRPVEFITRHLEGLLEAGRRLSQVIAPYSTDLGGGRGAEESSSLEESTSELYCGLWEDLNATALREEGSRLLGGRLPQSVIEEHIVGKRVLDLGCGSGRYSIALARLGACPVVALDLEHASFAKAQRWCEEHQICVEFCEGHVHELPFTDSDFDFVFCNGVLHHTSSIERGLRELARVLKPSGKAFLYLYAAGGIFWNTRVALREVFTRIPIGYTKGVLRMMGMPSHRFIFCDTWYVPVETLTTTTELHAMLTRSGLSFEKVVSNNPFDLDKAIRDGVLGAEVMWGDGEHRYIVYKT